MAGTNVITLEAQGQEDILWEYPDDRIRVATVLVVNEWQWAVFMRDGQILRVFEAGKYELTTANFPFLTKIMEKAMGYKEGIFKAKVIFVSKKQFQGKWGVRAMVKVAEDYQAPVPLMGNGDYTYRIDTPELFITQLVAGTKNFSFDGTSADYHEKDNHVQSGTLISGKEFGLPRAYVVERSDYADAVPSADVPADDPDAVPHVEHRRSRGVLLVPDAFADVVYDLYRMSLVKSFDGLRDGSAGCMSHDDHQSHAHVPHRVFEAPEGASVDHVARGTDHEQFADPRVENRFGDHTRIRACDYRSVRSLPFLSRAYPDAFGDIPSVSSAGDVPSIAFLQSRERILCIHAHDIVKDGDNSNGQRDRFYHSITDYRR